MNFLEKLGKDEVEQTKRRGKKLIVVGLDTMQIDVEILYIFASAVAGGLGLALAIGLGIALGLGGRDYVAEGVYSAVSPRR